jgi:hypothetical protein
MGGPSLRPRRIHPYCRLRSERFDVAFALETASPLLFEQSPEIRRTFLAATLSGLEMA